MGPIKKRDTEYIRKISVDEGVRIHQNNWYSGGKEEAGQKRRKKAEGGVMTWKSRDSCAV